MSYRAMSQTAPLCHSWKIIRNGGDMAFVFKTMHVYQMARSLAVDLSALVTRLSRVHFRAGDQLVRAVPSIMLNIAEGAGEFRRPQKARFYRVARRSCYETCAILDYLLSVGAVTDREVMHT